MELEGAASGGVQKVNGVMNQWVGMDTQNKCGSTLSRQKQTAKQDNSKAKLVYRHSMNTIPPNH